MALTSHLLEETEVLTENDTGGSHVFSILVEGIDEDAPKQRKLLDAISAAGVPDLLEQHSEIDAFAVRSRSVRFMKDTPTSAIVTVVYEDRARMKFGFGIMPGVVPLVISVDSTVQEVQTQKDVNGEQIILRASFDVPYVGKRNTETGLLEPPEPAVGDSHRGGVIKTVTSTPADVGDGVPESHLLEVEQTGFITMQVPFTTVSFARAELGPPSDKSLQFVGKINSVPTFGDPKHMWLCMKIAGTSRDAGQTYDVNYEFLRNPKGWNPDLVYIDGETGNPLKGANEADGSARKAVRVTGEANFFDLDIRV